MEGNANSNPLKPKELLPRRLFPNCGSSSRSRSLSQSASIGPVVSSLSQPQPEASQKSSTTAKKASSALAEPCQFGWSPLKSSQGFGSPVRASEMPNQDNSPTPVRTAGRVGAIRAAASITPVSPKITAPPDIHKSHKKEKAAARSPFEFYHHKAVDEEEEDNDPLEG